MARYPIHDMEALPIEGIDVAEHLGPTRGREDTLACERCQNIRW